MATLNIGPQPTLCVTVGLRIIIHCLRNVDFLGQTLIQPMRDISSGVVDWVKRAILLILRRALQAARGSPQLLFYSRIYRHYCAKGPRRPWAGSWISLVMY